jgi:hypothetical protein
VVTALAVGLLAGGCGGSAKPAGPKTVTLLLTAPSSGAVVNVRQIDVVGSVDPVTASVRVDRDGTRVKKGSFKHTLRLHNGVNKIRIVATALGYQAGSAVVSLRYRPAEPAGGPDGAFISQTNAACSKANDQVNKLPVPSTVAIAQSDFNRELQYDSDFINRLRSIHAPHPLAGSFAHFISLSQTELKLLSPFFYALKSRDLPEIRRILTKAERIVVRAANISDSLGMESCDAIVFPHGGLS